MHGQDEATNPEQTGTKAAFWWAFEAVPPGESVSVRLRLTAADLLDGSPSQDSTAPTDFEEVLAARRAETDQFYAQVLPEGTSRQDAQVARRAFAGLQWGKQL